MNIKYISGAVGGKTDKTSVLPGFSKIERGSSNASHCYGSLGAHALLAVLLCLMKSFRIGLKLHNWFNHTTHRLVITEPHYKYTTA